MSSELDPGKLSDRELLLVVYINQVNHLKHHDMYTRIALSAGFMGIINFSIALLLIILNAI